MTQSDATKEKPVPLPLPSGEHPQARELRKIRKRITKIEFALGAALTALLWWKNPEQSFVTNARSPFLPTLTYAAILAVCYGCLQLPLALWRERVEKRFGLSTQTLGGWVSDQLKGYALGAVLGTIVVLSVTALIYYTGSAWWWATALGATVFGVLLTRLAPQLILPLFFKLKPLDAPELQARFSDLPIFEIDLSRRTNAANAAVIGFGKTRKAVVGDTLLKEFSVDEVEFVLSHELAHHRYHDLWSGIAVGSVLTFVALAATNAFVTRIAAHEGIAFPYAGGSGQAFHPVLLFWIAVSTSVFESVLGPIGKLHSRFIETRADRFAKTSLGKSASGVSAFRKLGFQNRAVFCPPRWEEVLFYTHPCIARRIERLKFIETYNKIN